jgi:hypothetical protein
MMLDWLSYEVQVPANPLLHRILVVKVFLPNPSGPAKKFVQEMDLLRVCLNVFPKFASGPVWVL